MHESIDTVRIPRDRRLLIAEVFHSLQGEALAAGWPTVFVRLTGCPLRCRYCDTEYAFTGGRWRSFDDLLAEIAGHGARHVCVTGGEPLAQPNCPAFLEQLCDAGFEVSLETGGAHDIAAIDARVARVVDLKTPGSGEAARNRWANVEHLRCSDQIKFVICDRRDYEWARERLREHRLDERCTVLFSPSWHEQAARELAEWILEDRLPVRFQLQLHKVLWGEERAR